MRKLTVILCFVLLAVLTAPAMGQEIQMIDIGMYSVPFDQQKTQKIVAMYETPLRNELSVPEATVAADGSPTCVGMIVDRTPLYGDKDVSFQATCPIPAGTDIILLVSTSNGSSFAKLINFPFTLGEGSGFNLLNGRVPSWLAEYSLTFQVIVPAFGSNARVSKTVYSYADNIFGQPQITAVSQETLNAPFGPVSKILLKGNFAKSRSHEVVVDWFRVDPSAVIEVTDTTITIDPSKDKNLSGNFYTGRHFVSVRGTNGECDTVVAKLYQTVPPPTPPRQ